MMREKFFLYKPWIGFIAKTKGNPGVGVYSFFVDETVKVFIFYKKVIVNTFVIHKGDIVVEREGV